MPGPTPFHVAPPHAEVYGIYRVVRPLGEGASGRVFLAERMDFAQRVALKVFRSDFVTAGMHGGALGSEGNLLASLDHRHIVRVLQEGTTGDGVRFLAMEYVEGTDLLTHADAKRLSLKDRVHLLLQILEAVSYAHRHLVVHGDLKPANILVTPEDQARLMDFGSAVLLDRPQSSPDDGADETTGHTPAFASPEQRTGARATVVSDVYSLGLIARQLLAAVPPGSVPAEAPSRAISDESAEARGLAAGELRRALRGDLDAILLKALNTNPEQRYPTVDAMAADFRAYLESRTPAVRQAPLPERLRKWMSRHRLGAAMGAVLLLALLFSAVGVTVKAAQARRSRREAQARLRELVQLTGTLQSELYGSVRVLPNAGASEKLLTDSASATLDRLAEAKPADPTLRSELAEQYSQLARLELEQARSSGLQSGVPPAALRHLSASLAMTAMDDPHRAEREQLLASLRATNR